MGLDYLEDEQQFVSNEDVSKADLLLRDINHRRQYLIDLSCTGRGTTVMAAFKVLEKTDKGYIVIKATERELRSLERKHGRDKGGP